MPKLKPLPKKLRGKIHNANTDACDMLVGPCACGAWHSGEHVKKTRRRGIGGKQG